jgi:uncharacterized GH25 family protein
VRCKAGFGRLFGFMVVLTTASDASAHDLWLVPPEKAEAKSLSTIEAISGTKFPKGDRAPDTAKFKRRLLVNPDGADGVLTAAGKKDQSGLLTAELTAEPARPGVYIAAAQTEPNLITLKAAEFNNYLVSDGLAHVYRLRHKEGTLDQPGRERYSKSPKAIFRVGTGGEGDPCRVVGLPLEIVPLRSPFGLKVGDTLRVRVLFQKKPLPGANLGWDAPGEGDEPLGTARTDAQGEALIPVAQTGLMTIRLTHMTRPKAKEYEWESFWTTLTFHVPKSPR